VDEGLIERYLAGALSEAEVEDLESHYLACSRCQAELRLGTAIRGVLPDVREALLDGAQEPAAARPLPGRRVRIGAVVGAIAAVLAGVLLVRPASIESPRHREAVSEAEISPQVEMPLGEVVAPVEFRWTPVTTADLYEVTLYDAAGSVLWQMESREPHVALPDTVQLATDSLYLWQVTARVGWDRWVTSELARFTVSEP
jgi:hypothetical protein